MRNIEYEQERRPKVVILIDFEEGPICEILNIRRNPTQRLMILMDFEEGPRCEILNFVGKA